MRKVYWVIGVLIAMVAAIAGVFYLKSRPKVFHMGEGLQPKDTEFIAGQCSGGGRQDEKGVFVPIKQGMRSLGWDKEGMLEVQYVVVTNCDLEFTYGAYHLAGNKLVLEYTAISKTFMTMPNGQRVPLRAACNCGYDLQYKIRGLKRGDYLVDITEVTN